MSSKKVYIPDSGEIEECVATIRDALAEGEPFDGIIQAILKSLKEIVKEKIGGNDADLLDSCSNVQDTKYIPHTCQYSTTERCLPAFVSCFKILELCSKKGQEKRLSGLLKELEINWKLFILHIQEPVRVKNTILAQKPRANKKLPGIWAVLLNQLQGPKKQKYTADNLFDDFLDGKGELSLKQADRTTITISKDEDDELTEISEKNNRATTQTLTRQSFRRYVTDAKKILKNLKK